MKRLFFALLIFIPGSYLFSSGSTEAPDAGQIYNSALSLYRSGQYVDVESELNKIPAEAGSENEIRNLMLKSASEFRLGEGIAEESGDYTGALMNVDKSIGYLKRVIQLDSSNKVAANNLETAMVYRDELNRQREQEQQTRQSEDSLRSELDQLKEDQQDLADDRNKDSENHKNQQDGMKRRTEDLKNRGEGGSDFRDHMENAEIAQQAASDALRKGENDKAEEFQNEAVEHLESASTSLSGRETGRESSEQSEKQDNESEQLIQSIIDNENRRNDSADQSGSGIAVERNW